MCHPDDEATVFEYESYKYKVSLTWREWRISQLLKRSDMSTLAPCSVLSFGDFLCFIWVNFGI